MIKKTKNKISWKKEAEYYKRRYDDFVKTHNLSSDTPTIEEKNKPEVLNSKEIKAPQNALKQEKEENSNILKIEQKLETEETPKEEIKEIEEFKFECPNCSKQFNELNNGCCPFCDAELE